MSSFLVDKSVIDRVLTFLEMEWVRSHKRGSLVQLCELALSAGHVINPRDPINVTLTQIGQAMWELNSKAVNCRYDETNPPPSYCYAADPSNAIQAYKSLRCWLYQTGEGTCTEAPLYLSLSQLSNNLAHSIVTDLPEYKGAEGCWQ